MENTNMKIYDELSFVDESNAKQGLRGHVRVSIRDNETGKVSLWEESDNIIPISGYQWILMKMFNLYLDSVHDPATKEYEKLDANTNLIIPDLNEDKVSKIGINPNNYQILMKDNISADHFIQGFMIGCGGSGEDANTTKNTDYSFMKLRNPIPFRTTSAARLDPTIANKYLGASRTGYVNSDGTENRNGIGYFIKKFDDTPFIRHSWYRDGQKWDYVDPVTQNDLGPDGNTAGIGKTNRIETYAQMRMSIESDDCINYFLHSGSTQSTPMINELGLVAFNTVYGTRSMLENLHEKYIKPLMMIIFDDHSTPSTKVDDNVKYIASFIHEVLMRYNVIGFNNSRMTAFAKTIAALVGEVSGEIDYDEYMTAFGKAENIAAKAYYDQSRQLQYTEDEYIKILTNPEFDNLTTDEAERIKTITYYTFTSIPLQANTSILIDYRIYAN